MIGGCFLSAAYPFKADIYTKVRTISQRSGSIDMKWEFWKTINCMVGPFTSTSFKAQGTNENFGVEYEKQSFLKMLSKEELGRNVKVTNIRDKTTDAVIYREIEFRGTPPTQYNSNGSSPVLDPYGVIIEWDTTIQRADDQGDIVV
jgi:hypothetical protein